MPNDMSDTPRTELFFTNPPTTEESQEFAEKLERELNESRQKLEVYEQAKMLPIPELIAERNQLRKVVDELAYELKDLRPSHFGLGGELILARFEIKINLYNSLPHVQQRSKK